VARRLQLYTQVRAAHEDASLIAFDYEFWESHRVGSYRNRYLPDVGERCRLDQCVTLAVSPSSATCRNLNPVIHGHSEQRDEADERGLCSLGLGPSVPFGVYTAAQPSPFQTVTVKHHRLRSIRLIR